jgi:uncharacterized protein HemX
MLKSTTITALLCALILGGGLWLGVQAQDSKEKDQPKPATEKPKEKKEKSSTKLMRKKLAAAQDILEGLTTDDYELIAQGANQLKTLAGQADFRISKDMMYIQHSSEFEDLAEKLAKAAKDRNLDKASLHYVGLTMNCIECHRFVRDTLIAKR